MDEKTDIFCVDVHTHRGNQSTENEIEIINEMFDSPPTETTTNSYLSAGFHPWQISEKEWNPQKLIDRVKEKKVLAVGEIGLDKNISANQIKQINIFKEQIAIAEKFELPVVIHCVGFFNEIIRLKKELKPSMVWIIHGFRGKPQLAQQLIKSGLYLSFGKSILSAHPNLYKSLLSTPIDRVFLETDEADISIESLYSAASEILSISKEELKLYLYQNFRKVFKRYEQ